MSTISVLNTDTQLSGKTVVTAEGDWTVTGQWSFNRSPSAPFVVQAGSANVANLDADKLDGSDWAAVGTNILPSTDNARTLGSASFQWSNIYGVLLTISGASGFTGVATFTAQPVMNAGIDISGAASGQVKFPATQNASSGVNVLDDYEEGDWTPTIGGSGGQSSQTYAVQVGKYVKVGKLVTCWARIQLSAVGTITGNAQLKGLPFAADATTNYRFSGVIGEFDSWTTSILNLTADGAAGAQVMTLYQMTAASSGNTAVAQANFSANSAFTVTFSYLAAA